MTHSIPADEHAHRERPRWSERDASDRRAMLTEILTQVSMETLQQNQKLESELV